jgi:TonB family protein
MLFKVFAAILILVSGASAQSNNIKQELTGMMRAKVLVLRTFTKRNHLEFDEMGQSKTKAGDVGPWTIYSHVLVTKVDVSDSRLRIAGNRVIQHFNPTQDKLVGFQSNINVDIDIDLKKGATATDVAPALSNVFVAAPTLPVLLLPEYWRPYISGQPNEVSLCKATTQTVRVGGVVASASLLKEVRPTYPPEAKAFLLKGVVALQAEITETGDVGTLVILKPLGAGLDESAVEAVSQWKYKPTTLNGQPVCVVTTITVSYDFSR